MRDQNRALVDSERFAGGVYRGEESCSLDGEYHGGRLEPEFTPTVLLEGRGVDIEKQFALQRLYTLRRSRGRFHRQLDFRVRRQAHRSASCQGEFSATAAPGFSRVA